MGLARAEQEGERAAERRVGEQQAVEARLSPVRVGGEARRLHCRTEQQGQQREQRVVVQHAERREAEVTRLANVSQGWG